MPSTSTDGWVESQSCVSLGDVWKYHAIFPVSTFTVTTEQVYRFVCALRGPRTRAVYAGVGFPVPKMYRCVWASYDLGILAFAPPCCAFSRVSQDSSIGVPV